jgi:hypothetical protein
VKRRVALRKVIALWRVGSLCSAFIEPLLGRTLLQATC